MDDSSNTLEAVIKIAERCNINCSYCYMFNMSNKDYESRPKFMSLNTMENVAKFLYEGAVSIEAKSISVVLHGGEPLYMPKAQFVGLVSILRNIFDKDIALNIGLQTNAILVDEEWIDIFHKFKIDVSVSIDGNEQGNDEFRIDHRGNGTYKKALKGIKKLQEFAKLRYIPEISALAVINPNISGKETYRHMKDELGFRSFNFLLPMDSYETFDRDTIPSYRKYLLGILNEWMADDDPNVYVRMFDQFSQFIHTGKNNIVKSDYYVVTIASNGDLSGDDDLKELDLDHTYYNVNNINFERFINSKLIKFVETIRSTLPQECIDCDWKSYCRGGAQHGVISNRFSLEKGFSNKSVICDLLLEMYYTIAEYFINSGLKFETLENSLSNQSPMSYDASKIAKLPILNDIGDINVTTIT